MPCIVKKTFEEAAAAGALLIAQVKDNQPTLHQCAERVCQTSTPVDQTTTKDAKRRSRDETRALHWLSDSNNGATLVAGPLASFSA